MDTVTPDTPPLELTLPNLDATKRLAAELATCAQPGLVVLLDGPVGAGKTTLARHTIQTLLSRAGRMEDVPSPTFTIVQTYEASSIEVWHADLYRLTSTDELAELGLDTAFDTAFCLIEWPDRLGSEAPDHLSIMLGYGETEGTRHATIDGKRSAKPILAQLRKNLTP
ncbi:MAG: tRNA (adenosine(37)-N6)-threonylcarbamoyltransferase complex ATPase subunit type 1 TsaE [Pseudomonadota bacterium]